MDLEPHVGVSQFAQEAISFSKELKDRFVHTVSVIESGAKEQGKDVEIRVSWESDSKLHAHAEIIEVFPLRNRDAIQGGVYNISVCEGLLMKLIYGYEVLLTLMERVSKRSSLSPISIFQSQPNDDYLSEFVFKPNYFKFDLNADLVGLDLDTFNMKSICNQLDRSFWPFQISKRCIDQVTRQYVQFAVDFLAFHEASHITRGHLDYLREENNQYKVIECHSFTELDAEVKMRHLMEIDADQQSIINILINYFDTEVEDIQTFANVFTTSLTILYSFFDMRIRSMDAYKYSSHPDPDTRLLASVTMASTVFKHLPDNKFRNRKSISKIMLKSLHESAYSTIKAFQEIGILGGGPQRLAGNENSQLNLIVDDLIKSSVDAQSKWRHRAKSPYRLEDYEL